MGADFTLHPLIYTLLGFAQAQNVAKKKAVSKTPLCSVGNINYVES